VEEKWTIFPLPIIFAGSGEINFGIFFVDLNAFGQRDMAVLGGAYGSYGWTAIAMYNHTPNRQGVPGWAGVFMYGRNDKEYVDRYGEIQRIYSTDRLLFSLGINYEFIENVKGSFGISFSDIILRESDHLFNPPENGDILFGFRPGFSYSSSIWDGFLLSQKSFSLDYCFYMMISGSPFHQIDYRASYEQPIIPGFRFMARSAGTWKSTLDPLFEDGPQKAQVNILPRNYSSMNYFGASAGLEKYLYKNNWGTLSANGSWQCVFSFIEVSDIEFDHGPSVGMLFYLSRVALPAVGTNLAYNLVSGIYQFSFSIGMSF